MNITGYNLETLREKIRNLQEENNKLKELLKKSNIVFGENINTLTNDITEYNKNIKKNELIKELADKLNYIADEE